MGTRIDSHSSDFYVQFQAGWSDVFIAQPVNTDGMERLLSSVPDMQRWSWSKSAPPDRKVYENVLRYLRDPGPGSALARVCAPVAPPADARVPNL